MSEEFIRLKEGKEAVTVEVDKDAVEPAEYFKILKGKLKKAKKEQLEKRLTTVAKNIIPARDLGQKSYVNELAFTYDVIVKEQFLVTEGIDRFVYKTDIKTFIDKVTPKNSIKIIELERFPRPIPLDVMERISEVKDMGVFDEFCVVFTDLTDQDYSTKEEKEFVAKNRDPIVFGYFANKNTGLQHQRFYYIADWEDEYCDLTFDKMIDKMVDMGIKGKSGKSPENFIEDNHEYLQNIVSNTLANMNGKGNDNTPKSFWKRFKTWIGTTT